MLLSRKTALLLGLTALAALGLAAARPAAAQSLYVLDGNAEQVTRYDTVTGASQGAFTSGYAFSTPIGLAFGPDGSLYAGDLDNGEIARFDGKTGAYQKTVATTAVTGEIAVKPDGTVYDAESYAQGHLVDGQFVVTSPYQGHVLGYDATGAPVSDFPGGAGSEFGNLKFGPDGNFYVADDLQNRIVRFDGKTGAPLGAFTSGGDLSNPYGFVFGPDGNLYVGDRTENEIDRFNGKTGAYMDVFASGGGMNFPGSLAFGPDGSLYVASFGANEIERFNSTGTFRDVFASGVVGELAFAPTSPVPEASTTVSFGLLLTLGMGGLVVVGKRKRGGRAQHLLHCLLSTSSSRYFTERKAFKGVLIMLSAPHTLSRL